MKILKAVMQIVTCIGVLIVILGFFATVCACDYPAFEDFTKQAISGLSLIVLGMVMCIIGSCIQILCENRAGRKDKYHKMFEMYEYTKTVSRTDQSTTRL